MATFGETSLFDFPIPVSGQLLGYIMGVEKPNESINGQMLVPSGNNQSINGYIEVPLSSSGIFNGYLNGILKDDITINHYMKGIDTDNTTISGFIQGVGTEISETINSYLNAGSRTEKINAYLLANKDTISVGAYIFNDDMNEIKGWINGVDGVDPNKAKVNAYIPVDGTLSDNQGIFNAYIRSIATQDVVSGYIRGEDAGNQGTINTIIQVGNVLTHAINGFVNRNFSVDDTRIFGFIDGLLFIKAFILGGADEFSSPKSDIGAHLLASDTGVNNDFINAFVGSHQSEIGSVNAFVGLPDVIAQINALIGNPQHEIGNNSVNAFVRGISDDQKIIGFIGRPPEDHSDVNGFMTVVDSENVMINAFMFSVNPASGVINGYISGPEGEQMQIGGYLQQKEIDEMIKGLTSGWNGPHPPSPLA